MTKSAQATLFRVAASTFEKLAFLFTDSELTELQRSAVFEAGASVRFRGPISGRLVVEVYGDSLAALAANMLGQLDLPEPRVQWDALKEVANVICGNLLPELVGRGSEFQLDAPELSEQAIDESRKNEGTYAEFGLQEGRARICLIPDQDRDIAQEV